MNQHKTKNKAHPTIMLRPITGFVLSKTFAAAKKSKTTMMMISEKSVCTSDAF